VSAAVVGRGARLFSIFSETSTGMAGESNGESTAKTLALLLTVFAGLAVGTAAVFLQRIYAPFGVFPLIVGMLAGGATMLPLLLVRRRGFVLAISAALLAALGVVAAYHYGTFLVARYEQRVEAEKIAAARRAIERQMGGTEVAMPDEKPFGLAEYYAYQWQVGRPLGETKIGGMMLVAWWVLDGLLIWLGAAIVTATFTTRPDLQLPRPAAAPAGTADPKS
jgi:hypothetical protein